MFRPSSFFRLLGRVVLVVYFLAAALLLGMRYWVLPNIDQWRSYIATELSQVLDLQVRLGPVRAEWDGINPSLELTGVDLIGKHGRKILHLPRMRAELSWRSILAGMPRFRSIEASGLDLTIRRDSDRRLRVMGQSLSPDAALPLSQGGDSSGLRWLIMQRRVIFRDATVRWVDQPRGAPALVLRHVTLALANHGRTHDFSLSAIPPDGLGTRIELRGIFSSRSTSAIFSAQNFSGRLYARVDAADAARWSAWLDLPDSLESARVNAQAWVKIKQGRIERVASTLDLRDAQWAGERGAGIGMESGSLYVSGAWPALKNVFEPVFPGRPGQAPALPVSSPAPSARQVEFRLAAHVLSVQANRVFDHSVTFDKVSAQGVFYQIGDALHVRLDKADVANRDMELQFAGQWRQGGQGPAGVADIHGNFSRASIAAIERYLPKFLNPDALDWMSKGLVAGNIQDAQLVLRGDLDYFPFDDNPDKGDFHVQGRYSDGVVDYVPADADQPGWPRLTAMSGRIALDRADLRLVADTATISPAKGRTIHLSNVRARIPDLDHESILIIQGDTTAPAMSYLSLMRHSPLGGLLDHVFDDAQGTGVWDVPLQLTIPLRSVRDAAVRGTINFHDGQVSPLAEMPPLTHVAGALNFSEKGIDASQLKAQFMGGPIAISGGMTSAGGSLRLSGVAQAKALDSYVGLAGMSRITGQFPYRARIGHSKSGQYALTLDSNLSGLALDFPAPLKKSASQVLPLHVTWAPDSGAMALNATVGKTISALFMHQSKKGPGPFFSSGFVGVGRKTRLLDKGMNIDVLYPEIDIDEWRKVYDEFSGPARGNVDWETGLFPDVRQLRLESALIRLNGIGLDQATFTVRPAQASAGSESWRIDLSSSQSAGTIFWQQAQGKSAGSVKAKFERLALGGSSDGATSSAQTDSDLWKPEGKVDIPAISLQVDRFSLYGHPLGSLSVEGVNQARGELWRLDKLQLGDASFNLKGTGQWRLSGPDRGLTLEATADITDFGKYLDQMGFKNLMQGGKGAISGQLKWRNLPWAYQTSDLNGKFKIDLKKGSFSYQDSRSARLLKLLSLQSVSRLAKMEWNPGALIKDGFPYDTVHGDVALDQGVLKTDNYRVIGPVGTIALGGTTDMSTEKLDLQAVVIPNLDISGAAVAAGIAINPVVGIGAFLAQWLLRAPLAKSMATQYRISGDWDEPVITEVPVTSQGKDRADDPEKSGSGTKKAASPELPVAQH